MPIPLVHPAILMPLFRRPLMPAALAAGAMAPDLALFPGIRHDPHIWTGVLTVDTMTATVLVAVFAFARRPVADLMPSWVRARLAPVLAAPSRSWRSPTTWLALWVSAAIGACSHVLWDVAHGSWAVLGDYRQLGQDGTTLLGFAAMTTCAVVWLRRAPTAMPLPGVGHRSRKAAWMIFAGMSAGMLVLAQIYQFEPREPGLTVTAQVWWEVVNCALAASVALILGVLVWSMGWRAVAAARGFRQLPHRLGTAPVPSPPPERRTAG
ncbi:DUF4184 family protein [Streptomyces sp. NPDC002221]|uniref:DUF4184 family protein n=1 Tax=Streptomyces sp. NPDC002221 TaxID=3364639 RepID=UPI0036BDF3A3